MTFANTLTADFMRRREEARRNRNDTANNNNDDALIEAFRTFLSSAARAKLAELIENKLDEGQVATETTDDDHQVFDTLVEWLEFQQFAASYGYSTYKLRTIRPLTEAERNGPESVYYGRIGGKPNGVEIVFTRVPQMQHAELWLLSVLPTLARVKIDIAANVNKSNPTSSGNTFHANYPLPNVPADIYKLLACTNTWRNFQAACRELGLHANMSSYDQKITVDFTMSL